MHIFVDTTNIKNLEEEKAKLKCQNIMLASVSHEFRTPLNAFDNSLQLIKLKVQELKSLTAKEKVSSKFESQFASIESFISKFIRMGNVSSKLLMHLVEDILDLGKFESGTFSLNYSEFSISDIVNDLLYVFEWQWKRKGLKFTVWVCEDIMHKKYRSDQGRIKQVLMNLLSNAFKFTQQGSITIKINEKTELFDEFLEFSIIDTGIGIPRKDQPRLFKMFSMLDQRKEELNQKGTGLGLAISK